MSNFSQPMLPEERAIAILAAWTQLGSIFDAPKHVALREGTKAIREQIGLDLTPLLLTSMHMDESSDDDDDDDEYENVDVYFEPTILCKRYDMSDEEFNKWLEAQGLQYPVKGEWMPTTAGRPLCELSAWTMDDKSGHIIKWNVSAIEEMMS